MGLPWTGRAHERAVDTAHLSPPCPDSILCDKSSPGQVLVAGGQWQGLCLSHRAQRWEGPQVLQRDRLGHAGSLWGGLSWVNLVAGEGALHSGMRRLCPWEGWDAVLQKHSTSSRYQRKKTCWQSTSVLLWLFSHCMVKPYITLIRINLSENKGIYYFSQL